MKLPVLFVVGSLGVVGGAAISLKAISEVTHELNSPLKEQVINSGISKKDYNYLDSSIFAKHGCDIGSVAAWQKAADSIATKGKVDSAYLKGAQMVRDSIAATKIAK